MLTVPINVEVETEAEISQIVIEGFQSTTTSMVIEFSADRASLVQTGLYARRESPQFVFEWTDKGSEQQRRCIRAWWKWNEEHRTLQRKIGDDYWIITKWITQNAWTIEKWNRTSFDHQKFCPLAGLEQIVYIKRELRQPREGDIWYNCGADGRRISCGYDFPDHQMVPDLKIIGFPTKEAAVHGSKHKEIHSEALVQKGGAKIISYQRTDERGMRVSHHGGFNRGPRPCGPTQSRSQSGQRLLQYSQDQVQRHPNQGGFGPRDQGGYGGARNSWEARN